MSEVENAEKTVRDLEDKRRALIQAATELADERQRVSFAAHTGDGKARSRLDQINVAVAAHASEMVSIEAAITQANANLDAARRDAAAAADRANAEQLRQHLKEFVECGLILDDCFADFRETAIKMQKLLTEIHGLGCAAPSDALFRVNCDLAFKTAVMGTPFWSQDFPTLGHGQKKSFKGLVEAWSANVESNIAARLGEKQEEAA
jgi:hypothetical protein